MPSVHTSVLTELLLPPTETLGVLARALGESMKPLAEECCQLGLGLCIHVDDPDVRRCT